MGDDVGVGLLTSLIGGLVRGGQLLKSVGTKAAPQIIRLADPRRVRPILQAAKETGSRAKAGFMRPSAVTQSIPGLNKLPVWAQNIIVPASPAGIALSMAGLEGSAANRPEQYGPPTPERQPTQAELNRRVRIPGVYQGGAVNPLVTDYGPPVPPVNIPGTMAYQRAAGVIEPPVRTGGPTPPPSAGNRVEQATTQAETRPMPQAPRVAAPAGQIPMSAYEAAVTTGQAPANTKLTDLYRAQEHIGRYMEESGELQRRLKEVGASAGMTDEALMAWAQKNPALAYRAMFNAENRRRKELGEPTPQAVVRPQ